jgi:hypothetical protein
MQVALMPQMPASTQAGLSAGLTPDAAAPAATSAAMSAATSAATSAAREVESVLAAAARRRARKRNTALKGAPGLGWFKACKAARGKTKTNSDAQETASGFQGEKKA